MAQSQAFFAHGTKLFLTDSEYANPVEVAEIVDIPISISQDILDATHHGSGGWKEKKVGLKDGGNLTLDLHWLPSNTTHQQLLDAFNDSDPEKDPLFFLIQSPGSGKVIKLKLSAYVASPSFPFKNDDLMRGSVTLALTGPVQIAFENAA